MASADTKVALSCHDILDARRRTPLPKQVVDIEGRDPTSKQIIESSISETVNSAASIRWPVVVTKRMEQLEFQYGRAHLKDSDQETLFFDTKVRL